MAVYQSKIARCKWKLGVSEEIIPIQRTIVRIEILSSAENTLLHRME
jgi:hypothetical protein